MPLLKEGLADNGTTNSFKVHTPGEVFIEVIGTYDSETVHLEKSFDNSTFVDYYADGSLVSWSQSIEGRRFILPAGFYRLVCSTGAGGTSTDLDVYVSGRMVVI